MGTIKVDTDLFPSIAAFYQEQRGDMLEAKSYVQEWCTLSDAYGLLLLWLKGPYEDARDKGFGAFQAIADLIDALAHQVEGFEQDTEELNSGLQAQIDALVQQMAELQAAQNASNNGGYQGGGGATGGGGGGIGGGGGGSIPTPTAPPVEAPQPERDITITINGGGGDDDIKVNVDADGNIDIDISTDDDTETDDPTDGTDATPPVPGTDPADLTPEERAEYEEFMDEFWAERAAEDPLGRTADELRALWEERDPVAPSEGDLVGVGYAASGSGGGAASANIGSILPESAVATGTGMTL